MSKEQIEQILASVLQSASDVNDFIVSETPLVAQELLRWHFAQSIAQNLLCLGMVIVAVIFFKKMSPDDDVDIVIFMVVITFSIIATFMLANLTWLKIWLAPKVYILEYAADLVK